MCLDDAIFPPPRRDTTYTRSALGVHGGRFNGPHKDGLTSTQTERASGARVRVIVVARRLTDTHIGDAIYLRFIAARLRAEL